MNPKIELATEPEAKLLQIEELLVLIASITINNISLSKLHDLIKTYSNKKQANHHNKPLQKVFLRTYYPQIKHKYRVPHIVAQTLDIVIKA